jgi:hypothetical protein|tara:strand:- start:10522 stop:11058 length:537 start_codon:yes stop_codon:yes gene_type:complete
MEELKKLRQRKIRLRLRYLQTELQETKLIYKNCLEQFNKDFSEEYFQNNPVDDLENQMSSNDPYEKINSDVDDDTIKEVYRKVAGKTHPDKKDGDDKMFKVANEANRNRDFGALLEMADELELDIKIDDKMLNEMSKQCNGLIQSVKNMKTTMAWTWIHIEDDNKQAFKQYILSQLNT